MKRTSTIRSASPLRLGLLVSLLAGCGLFAEEVVFDEAVSFAEVSRPMGVTVLADGRVAATDTLNGTVEVFGTDGAHLASWAGTRSVSDGVEAPGFIRPLKLAANATTLYVTDFLADRVVRLDARTGRVHGVWGRSGTAPGALSSPAGIAVGSEGRVWVTEFHNHRIQVFGPAGELRLGVGGRGGSDGVFSYPTGVAVADDAVFVADAYNHRVRKLTLAGELRETWGSPFGWPWPFAWEGFFNVASGVAATDRWLFVSDEFHDTVQVSDHSGVWRGLASRGTVAHPTDVAVSEQGDLYVADFGNDRIVRLPWGVE